MKEYIPHRLLVINDQVEKSTQDETFMHCMKMAFQWANDMGLKGKKVFGLFLETPDPSKYDPLRQHSSLWCKIECTKEEREQWEEMKDLQVKQYVNDILKE
jgi:hypothetical protein